MRPYYDHTVTVCVYVIVGSGRCLSLAGEERLLQQRLCHIVLTSSSKSPSFSSSLRPPGSPKPPLPISLSLPRVSVCLSSTHSVYIPFSLDTHTHTNTQRTEVSSISSIQQDDDDEDTLWHILVCMYIHSLHIYKHFTICSIHNKHTSV